MKKTKIEWCDYTINPVIGCKRGCPYCYAKKMNDRFHFVKDFSRPERKEKSFNPILSKKSISVFFDSMSDFEYWTDEEISDFQSTILHTNHYVSLIGLTKSVDAISRFRKIDVSKFGNVFEGPILHGFGLWLGYTIDGKAQIDKIIASNRGLDADFLSIEPLECDIADVEGFNSILISSRCLKLVIIGAETGNRKEKVECRKQWVDKIVSVCDSSNLIVFMKSSLKDIMGKDFRQDKLPWPVGEKE